LNRAFCLSKEKIKKGEVMFQVRLLQRLFEILIQLLGIIA